MGMGQQKYPRRVESGVVKMNNKNHVGSPKWMVSFMENPTKMDDDRGYPYDLGNHHVCCYLIF